MGGGAGWLVGRSCAEERWAVLSSIAAAGGKRREKRDREVRRQTNLAAPSVTSACRPLRFPLRYSAQLRRLDAVMSTLNLRTACQASASSHQACRGQKANGALVNSSR